MMSRAFAGFSDEDIIKLKSENPMNQDVNKTDKTVAKIGKKSILKNKTAKTIKNTTTVAFDLPDTAKLSVQETDVKINGTQLNNAESKSDNVVTVDVSKIEKKVINLDEFQARQKFMEEQNRKRKELLAKALADRTKRTEEEARRLKEIQNEFKKLDDLLSNDVKILRQQIEIASIDFMEAQKRYHKIEKDFLDAKLALHQKLEKKEMLTEHLCAIIEKNEERKAEKLSELMNKLSVKEDKLEEFNYVEKTEELNGNNNKVQEANAENGAKSEEVEDNTNAVINVVDNAEN